MKDAIVGAVRRAVHGSIDFLVVVVFSGVPSNDRFSIVASRASGGHALLPTHDSGVAIIVFTTLDIKHSFKICEASSHHRRAPEAVVALRNLVVVHDALGRKEHADIPPAARIAVAVVD